jgi:hypothetical protein
MLDDLIARLEAAPKSSRELDARIENLLAGGSEKDLAYILGDIERITRPPHYTTSLDAALTLVPEGALWELDHKLNLGPAEDGYATPAGEPKTIYRAGCGVQLPNEKMSSWFRHQHFTEPALAVCIVALRARAAGSAVIEGGAAG